MGMRMTSDYAVIELQFCVPQIYITKWGQLLDHFVMNFVRFQGSKKTGHLITLTQTICRAILTSFPLNRPSLWCNQILSTRRLVFRTRRTESLGSKANSVQQLCQKLTISVKRNRCIQNPTKCFMISAKVKYPFSQMNIDVSWYRRWVIVGFLYHGKAHNLSVFIGVIKICACRDISSRIYFKNKSKLCAQKRRPYSTIL